MFAVSPDPSLFVFVINTTFMSWIVCFLLICIYVNLPRGTFTKWAYIWHIFSVNAQTRLSMHAVSQSLHCSLTYTKCVSLWYLLSVNAQTSLNMRAVSQVLSLLSHMRKMGVHTAYSFSQCSDEP